MRSKKLSFCILLFLLPIACGAQELGFSAAFNKFTRAKSIQRVIEQPRVFGAFDVKLGYKVRGTEYAAMFGFPRFGVGFSYAALGSCETVGDIKVGDSFTLYAFFQRDLIRSGSFRMGYSAEMGPAFMTRWYDPVNNPRNDLYGGPVTMHDKLGLYAFFNVSPRFTLGAELAFRHNSSGRLYVPNEGLNSFSGALMASYTIGDKYLKPGSGIPSGAHYNSKFRVSVFAGGGIHKCMAEYLVDKKLPGEERRIDYMPWFKGSAGVEGVWRYSRKCSLSLQAELHYLSNTEALRDADNVLFGKEDRTYSPLSPGIGITQEVYFGPFTVGAGVGAYLFREVGVRENHGRLYQKVSFRYYPPRLVSYFAGMSIRAHEFGRADYIEFSLGRIIGSWN